MLIDKAQKDWHKTKRILICNKYNMGGTYTDGSYWDDWDRCKTTDCSRICSECKHAMYCDIDKSENFGHLEKCNICDYRYKCLFT